MDILALRDRFEYHPPSSPAVGEDHAHVRERLLDAAVTLNNLLPEGREKSLAITKLEEAMFWANAAIARSQ